MAYTSIIPVHRLDNSVDYVLDEKKASRSQNADSLQAAVDYALNKDKTEQDLFCSAIGCTLDSAFEDMCHIKRMWHKEKGVQGFHLVQSFAAGEVTPELAHQIGQELAYRLLGGRFQVVISTHLTPGISTTIWCGIPFPSRRGKSTGAMKKATSPGCAGSPMNYAGNTISRSSTPRNRNGWPAPMPNGWPSKRESPLGKPSSSRM